MMGAVFAMQGIGQFAAAIIALIVTAAFQKSLESAKDVAHCTGVCQLAVDKMWRTIIGMGALPGLIALYFRLTIPESPRYTLEVSRDPIKAEADIQAYIKGYREGSPDQIQRIRVQQNDRMEALTKASWSDFARHYWNWTNGRTLLGTAGSWFFLDVGKFHYVSPCVSFLSPVWLDANLLYFFSPAAFYGLGLNNSIILGAIGWTGGKNVYQIFYRNAVGNLILICAGAIPGYWVTVATVDTIGRKPIQIGGFTLLTILFIAIGFGFDKLKHSHNGLLALYVLAQFFFNFGPNATTFIVLGECFPTRYRSTSHGFSAAAGKVGAIIAQCVFGPLVHRGAKKGSSDSPWLNHVMQIFALFMFCGIFTSFLIPETKRKTLEELSGNMLPSPAVDGANDVALQALTRDAEKGNTVPVGPENMQETPTQTRS